MRGNYIIIMFLSLGLVFFTNMFSHVHAEDIISQLNIDQAIQQAIANNKELANSKIELDRKKEAIKQAWANVYPLIKFEIEKTKGELFQTKVNEEIFNELIQNSGLQDVGSLSSTRETNQAKISISQLIYGAHVFPTIDLANIQYTISHQEFLKKKQSLIYDVKFAYVEAIKSQQAISLIKKNIVILDKKTNEASNMYDDGHVSKEEFLRLKSQLTENEIQLQQQKNTFSLSKKKIKLLSGGDEDFHLERIELPTFNSIVLPKQNLKYFLDTAYMERHDLKIARLKINLNQKRKAIDASNTKPEVYLIGNYGFANSQEFQFNKESEEWLIGIKGTWTLFDGFLTPSKLEQNQLKENQIENSTIHLLAKIDLEVHEAFYSFQTTYLKLKNAFLILETEKEKIKTTKREYHSGKVKKTAMLDAERAYLQAKLNLTNTYYDFLLSETNLNKKIGILKN